MVKTSQVCIAVSSATITFHFLPSHRCHWNNNWGPSTWVHYPLFSRGVYELEYNGMDVSFNELCACSAFYLCFDSRLKDLCWIYRLPNDNGHVNHHFIK